MNIFLHNNLNSGQNCKKTNKTNSVLFLHGKNQVSFGNIKIKDEIDLAKGFSPQLGELLREMKKDYAHLRGKDVAMLFSGGFDTSFLAKVFSDEIGAKVHTITFEIGDNRFPLDKSSRKAMRIGVHRHNMPDVKDEFVEEYVLPSIFANAKYNGRHPLSSSLSRPLMMKKAIEYARENNCHVIVQGTSPWQNNAPRFQKAFEYLAAGSELRMVLPVLEKNIPRELEYEYLGKKGLEITEREDEIFSADGNIWNWEAEDGKIRTKPFYRPNLQTNGIFNIPENAPDTPEVLNITFLKGIPVRLNGKEFKLANMIERLNEIGGKHGVGIHDALEARPLGFKEREIHVAPAADILIAAHEDLEQTVLPDEVLDEKQMLDKKWTRAVCSGDWFNDKTKMWSESIKRTQDRVTGVVRLKLYKGHIDVMGRKSPYAQDAETLRVEERITPTVDMFRAGSMPLTLRKLSK